MKSHSATLQMDPRVKPEDDKAICHARPKSDCHARLDRASMHAASNSLWEAAPAAECLSKQGLALTTDI